PRPAHLPHPGGRRVGPALQPARRLQELDDQGDGRQDDNQDHQGLAQIHQRLQEDRPEGRGFPGHPDRERRGGPSRRGRFHAGQARQEGSGGGRQNPHDQPGEGVAPAAGAALVSDGRLHGQGVGELEEEGDRQDLDGRHAQRGHGADGRIQAGKEADQERDGRPGTDPHPLQRRRQPTPGDLDPAQGFQDRDQKKDRDHHPQKHHQGAGELLQPGLQKGLERAVHRPTLLRRMVVNAGIFACNASGPASSSSTQRTRSSLRAPNQTVAARAVSWGSRSPSATAWSRYRWISSVNRWWMASTRSAKGGPMPMASTRKILASFRWRERVSSATSTAAVTRWTAPRWPAMASSTRRSRRLAISFTTAKKMASLLAK